MLFDCSTNNVGLHLKNIYDSGELEEKATTGKISVVRQEGTREVNIVFIQRMSLLLGNLRKIQLPRKSWQLLLMVKS